MALVKTPAQGMRIKKKILRRGLAAARRKAEKYAEIEEENLNVLFVALKKIYWDRKPIDLIRNLATKKKYDEKTRKNLLRKHGERLADFFSTVRGRMSALMRKEIFEIEKLDFLFDRTLVGKEAELNMKMVMRIKAKQDVIRRELYDLIVYWQQARDSGRFPFFSRFNKRKIIEPLSRIKKEELDLLREIDRKLSSIKV